MNYTYTTRKKAELSAEKADAAREPALDALRTGAAVPTQEQMGRRVDLPDAMREKMENAFGADLSAVRLYESQAVEDAGANAVTQGSNIAFAPGMLDFSSYGGQALLGHEISHVVSQARGEVTGSGFLNDHALEARADREGAMAASGQTVGFRAAEYAFEKASPETRRRQISFHISAHAPSRESFSAVSHSGTLDETISRSAECRSESRAFSQRSFSSSREALTLP